MENSVNDSMEVDAANDNQNQKSDDLPDKCVCVVEENLCKLGIDVNDTQGFIDSFNTVENELPTSSDSVLTQMCIIADEAESKLDNNNDKTLQNVSCELNKNDLNNALEESGTCDVSEILVEESDKSSVVYPLLPCYLLDKSNITQISCISKDFKQRNGKECFLKGCKWAPDGTCLLTNSEDQIMRLFDLPQEMYSRKEWPEDEIIPDIKCSVNVGEGGLIYDFCWYPLMSSWNPVSCCFLSSAAGEPVHLWDAYNGELRASYRSYNYADEIMSAYSLCICSRGENLFCGFKNKINIFSVQIPGNKSVSFDTKGLTGQTGLVSAIAVNPCAPHIFAAGTYQKTVGLFDVSERSGICVFSGHSGGITHMLFSPDGYRLYTGSRMDPEIVCWDLRNYGKVLFSLQRTVTTNQRIYFDLTPGNTALVSGNTNGEISIWNLNDNKVNDDTGNPHLPDLSFRAHKDCSNGASINQHYPVLATSSGQRHVPDLIVSDNEDDDVGENCQIVNDRFFDAKSVDKKREDCVKLWWCSPINHQQSKD